MSLLLAVCLFLYKHTDSNVKPESRPLHVGCQHFELKSGGNIRAHMKKKPLLNSFQHVKF